LDHLRHEASEVKVRKLSAKRARIEVHSVAHAGGAGQSFRNRYVYDIFGSGDIVLRHSVTPEVDNVPWLPKIGLQMEVGNEFRNLTWYGYGPFETYPDRKTGAKIGIYRSTAEKDFVPYLVGQDQANKTGVRWITLNIDHRVSGVGGTPVTARPEFRTYPDHYEYSIRLRPFSGERPSVFAPESIP